MNDVERKKLNQRVGYLRNAILRLDEETYRTIVASIDEKSGGYLRNCDDEHANLVLLTLQRMAEQGGRREIANAKQHRQIARLMQFLRWDWKATAKFCRHQTGKHTTRQCNSAELSKIIIGMVRIIDAEIESGRLLLTENELREYREHTPCGIGRRSQQSKEEP